jgi:dihydroflavonol-4-reductase
MQAVVTGASGHLGACLVRELLRQGHAVKVVDLDPGAALDGLNLQVLRQAIAPGDVVFHLASVISTSGDKGGLVTSVNVDGARNVAVVCREVGVKRLVHTSSIHAFDIDTHGAPVTEQTRLAIGVSDSAYNVSKARGQLAVLDEVGRGLDAVVVNPVGVIGPYDYKASRMGKFFRAVARGTGERVGPGGFNWVDVRDVAAGAIAALERGRAGEAYILAGHWNTNLALSKIASRITGNPVPDAPIPMWFLRALHAAGPLLSLLGQRPPVTKEALDALTANPVMSHAKATAELGYQPRPVEDTIAAIYTWLKDEDILAKEKAARAARKA